MINNVSIVVDIPFYKYCSIVWDGPLIVNISIDNDFSIIGNIPMVANSAIIIGADISMIWDFSFIENVPIVMSINEPGIAYESRIIYCPEIVVVNAMVVGYVAKICDFFVIINVRENNNRA